MKPLNLSWAALQLDKDLFFCQWSRVCCFSCLAELCLTSSSTLDQLCLCALAPPHFPPSPSAGCVQILMRNRWILIAALCSYTLRLNNPCKYAVNTRTQHVAHLPEIVPHLLLFQQSVFPLSGQIIVYKLLNVPEIFGHEKLAWLVKPLVGWMC